MNIKVSQKTAIYFILLILFSNFIHCSSKMKTDSSKLRSNMRKAKIKVSKTGVDCSATKVIGVNGSCANMNPSGANGHMPSDFSAAWNVLNPILSTAIPTGPQMCLGDFQGSALDGNDDLGSDLCNTIPVVSDGNFGLIGMSASQLPCGKPTDVAMCVAFDKCGTFALAFNLGIPVCIATIAGSATGIIAAVGAAASLFADVVGNFSIGFSVGRRFTTDIRLAYRDGDKVHSDTITTYGHLFLDVGINLPTDFLKFGKRDLSEYFSITADILYMIDFGDVDTVVNSMINTLKSANKSTAKTILNSIIKSGPELTLCVEGVLTLGLQDMTKGLLADFSMTLASANILITGGSGRSALESGVYFRLGSNVISDLINSLQGIFDSYSDIFDKLGFSGYTLPSAGIELGLFLTTSAFGFQFTLIGFSIKCMFLYDTSDFSCSINSKIFTVILDGLNFVFRHATKFFDKTGKIIATKTAAEFRNITKQVSETVKKSVGYVKNTAGTLIKLGTEQFIDLKNEFEENVKWIKNNYKNIASRSTKVLSEAANVAKKKAAILACNLKYVLNKKKKKNCKESVKEKYDNDSNNEISTCSDNEFDKTAFTSDGSGNIFNLTSHAMKCDTSEYINYFKLERSGANMRYRYKCISVPQITAPSCYTANTKADIVGDDVYHTVQYLDRHKVSCKSGYGLKEVQLIKDSSNTIHYQYKCCTFPLSYCSYGETSNEDYGDKTTYNLDRVTVDAGQYRILSSFKLNSIGQNEFNYTYKSCASSENVKTSYDTGCNDNGNGSIFYLDRHTVSCGTGNALNRFQLFRENDTIRYNYNCIYSESISTTCSDYTTPVNSTRDGDSTHTTHYLDRHDVNCPNDSLLTDFVLTRSGSRNIYYKYTCCKASITSCVDQYTSWQDGGNYQNYYLDRQNVDATGTKVLGRFWMDTNSKGDWRYLMRVCTLSD